MKNIFKIAGYGVGVLFIVAGVTGLFIYESGKIAGLFYVLAGISILPPVFSKIKNKTKYATVVSLSTFLIFTVIAGVLAPLPDTPTVSNNESADIVTQKTQDSTNKQAKAENKLSESQDTKPLTTAPEIDTVPNTNPEVIRDSSTEIEFNALPLLKATLGNESQTIEAMYKDEVSTPAVTGYGWASIKNPKGDGWFVGYKTEVAGNESLPIWWVKDKNTIYWVNGKASSRTNKTLQLTPFNASGMSVSDIYTLMESQSFSE